MTTSELKDIESDNGLPTQYQDYVRLLRELHSLTAEGNGDTDEAERLRDLMDAPWYRMSPQEIRRVRGLSADLHTLVDPSPPPQQLDQKLIDETCQLAADAWSKKDWDGALELLRERPHPYPPDRVAFMRAGCWENLGDLETSVLFLERAVELNPDHGYYLLVLVYTLLRLGRVANAILLAERIINAQVVYPDLLYKVATTLIGWTHAIGDTEEAKLLIAKSVDAIQRAFEHEQRLPENERVKSSTVAGLVNLAMCYRRLGRDDLAHDAYDTTLKLDPRNDAALVGRGLLLFRSDQEAAMGDFKQALEGETPSVWPHYFYAFYLLRSNRFDDCVRVCRAGLQKTNNPSLMAEFFEWIAISQDSLGEDQETVRSSFENAWSHDPWNQTIERNYQLFRQSVAARTVGVRTWDLGWGLNPDDASRELFSHIN